MRHGRFLATVLAAATTLAVAPAMASAAMGTLTDDNTINFTQGPGLPSGFTDTGTGSAVVASGALTVKGDLVKQAQSYGPGQILEFTATLTSEPFQHVGLAADLNDSSKPFALITTSSGGTVFARTADGAGTDRTSALPVTPGTSHTYRIEWKPTEVDYFIDGAATPAVTDPVTIAGQMSPVISDGAEGDGDGLSVESIGVPLFAGEGTYESRVFDAQDPNILWDEFSSAGEGADFTFQTRQGNTPTPDGTWTPWQSLLGNAIRDPGTRYIQYQVQIGAPTGSLTPTLDNVHMKFVDESGPDATIDGVQVTGDSARLAFSSAATDLDHFECAVDFGAFSTCSSPADFGGFAPGPHTVAARAVDKLGNIGNEVSKAFTIPSPASTSTSTSGGGSSTSAASSGGTTQGTTTQPKPDKTAPRVTVTAQSLRASTKGTITLKVSCPKTETRCRVAIELKRGKTVLAHKTVTVNGGKTKKVTLQLTKAARRQLAKAHSLKVSQLVTARDLSGNARKTTKTLKLRAPAK